MTEAAEANRAAPIARPARHLVVRAVLVSIAVLVALVPGVVVLGGYAPHLPTIGWLGRFLTTDLPAIVVYALAALALALVAIRLGGGRFTKLLAGGIGVVLAGALLAGGQLWQLLSASGARYAPELRLAPGPGYGTGSKVVFATVDGIDLHAGIWQPFGAIDDPSATPRQPGPAVVFVHGGAFVGGELDSRPWLFQAVTKAGFTVVDIEYRLAPPPRWIDAPSDVLCALAWVGEHAAELWIDPTRVTLAGDSAGGSLALLAGYTRLSFQYDLLGAKRIESSCGGTPVVPAGIVAIEPAADLVGLWHDRTISDGRTTFPEAYIGGPPSAYPDRYAAASPFALINSAVSPTLIVTGANDHLVGLARVRSIADALEQAGARSRLIVIPFADHGLDGAPSGAGAQLMEALLPRFVADPVGAIAK